MVPGDAGLHGAKMLDVHMLALLGGGWAYPWTGSPTVVSPATAAPHRWTSGQGRRPRPRPASPSRLAHRIPALPAAFPHRCLRPTHRTGFIRCRILSATAAARRSRLGEGRLTMPFAIWRHIASGERRAVSHSRRYRRRDCRGRSPRGARRPPPCARNPGESAPQPLGAAGHAEVAARLRAGGHHRQPPRCCRAVNVVDYRPCDPPRGAVSSPTWGNAQRCAGATLSA